MDLKDANNQKIAIAVLAFFIVVYFWYSRIYSRYDEQLTMKGQEFETITTNLKNVEMKAKSLDALQAEYTQLVERYHDIESLLPEEKMIPNILVQLHTASSLSGTKIKKVLPQPPFSEEFFNVASFQIEMTGTYHDFGNFISYVANFPFIANVTQMDIKTKNVAISGPNKQQPIDEPTDRLEIGKKKETMTATFLLSTYYVKEEERLKELSL